MKYELFMRLIAGGQVRRFHGHPVNHQQTNMHHGARVALIAREIKPTLSADALAYMICHDTAEIDTGDIPSPAKQRYPALGRAADEAHDQFMLQRFPPLTDEDYIIMKAADYLETMLFCCEEKELGNTTMDEIFKNCQVRVISAMERMTVAYATTVTNDYYDKLGARYGW